MGTYSTPVMSSDDGTHPATKPMTSTITQQVLESSPLAAAETKMRKNPASEELSASEPSRAAKSKPAARASKTPKKSEHTKRLHKVLNALDMSPSDLGKRPIANLSPAKKQASTDQEVCISQKLLPETAERFFDQVGQWFSSSLHFHQDKVNKDLSAKPGLYQ